VFQNAKADLYWTSTQNEGIPTLGWTVTFNLGVMDGISVSGLGYARCVRHIEPPQASSGSCSCDMPGVSGRTTAALWALALAALAVVRRRPGARERKALRSR
jgi:MYXO-CTERM domain-containing protein